MEMNAGLWQILTPVISYVGTAVLKAIWAKLGGGTAIPSWLKPVIAGLLGTATGLFVGNPDTMAMDAAIGFGLGGGAPAINEIKQRVFPTTTAGIGNG